jgi:FkbM family methyltransferase
VPRGASAPGGRVFAFEARAANAALLARNAAANGAENVVVLPLAVSDRAALWRYVPAQGTNGYIEPVAPGGGPDVADAALVQSVRLDDLASWIGPVDLLQLDVDEAAHGRRNARLLKRRHR